MFFDVENEEKKTYETTSRINVAVFVFFLSVVCSICCNYILMAVIRVHHVQYNFNLLLRGCAPVHARPCVYV